MLQNTSTTLGFKKIMVYKTPPGGGGGKPYLAHGLKGKELTGKRKIDKQRRLHILLYIGIALILSDLFDTESFSAPSRDSTTSYPTGFVLQSFICFFLQN